MGSRFGSDYRFGGDDADELDKEWNDRHGMMAISLEYGRPYARVKKPLDYFTLNFFGEGGLEGKVLQMDIMGKLINRGIHGHGHWLDFSVNLDYDTFYGDLATVSTLSLGGAMDLALWLTPDLRFRVMNQIYWIMLGSADMGYDDIRVEPYKVQAFALYHDCTEIITGDLPTPIKYHSNEITKAYRQVEDEAAKRLENPSVFRIARAAQLRSNPYFIIRYKIKGPVQQDRTF